MPGPSQGGEGTAGMRDGYPIWYDGETLLILVDTVGGKSIHCCAVHADGDQLSFCDPETGDDNFGYTDKDIDWWARLDETNLPENVKSGGAPR